MKKSRQISKREAERRMMQSAFSPRKISEAEADEWLRKAKIERLEREQQAAEAIEFAESHKPGGTLKWAATMILVWAGFFGLLMALRAVVGVTGCQ